MIIAHAPLASSLKAVAEHTYPDCGRRLQALDVPADMSIDDVEVLARAMLSRIRTPEAVIFTDVFGATPCNVAQRLSDGLQVKVIAGVNVPMLWRSLCYAAGTLDEVVDRAMAGAAQGVMQVASTRPQNQTTKPCGHDKEDPAHQQ